MNMYAVLIVFATVVELISGQPHRELIPDVNEPQQILRSSIGDVIFVKDEKILSMDLISKEVKDVGERKPNEFVGLDENGDIVMCGIEHFMINSKEEFSTIFTVNGKELKFFPTIKPVYLRGDTIIAMTALDFLEQHYYKISISTGEMKEIEEPKQVRNEYLYLEKDEYGNVYLNYDTREIFKLFVSKGIDRVKL